MRIIWPAKALNKLNFLKMNIKTTIKKIKVLLLIVFVFGLFLLPRYLERQVKLRAEIFCNSLQVGESLQSLLTKCVAAKINCTPYHSEKDSTQKYSAMFSGFLLNVYMCEIHTQNNKVTLKFFEEFTD